MRKGGREEALDCSLGETGSRRGRVTAPVKIRLVRWCPPGGCAEVAVRVGRHECRVGHDRRHHPHLPAGLNVHLIIQNVIILSILMIYCVKAYKIFLKTYKYY